MPRLSDMTLVRLGPDVNLNKTNLSQLLNVPEESLIIEQLTSYSPNLRDNFHNRFEMFIKGAFFCIDRMPDERFSSISIAQKENLKLYLTGLQSAYITALEPLSANTDISLYQTLLLDYCCKLVAAFKVQFGYSTSQVKSMISTAEEYQVLLQGRPNLVTVSDFYLPQQATSNSQFEESLTEKKRILIQQEKKISPLSSLLRNAFWVIKEYITGQYHLLSQLPRWYIEMDPLEKCYLEHALSLAKQKGDLDKIFSCYSSRMRSVLGPANYRFHQYLWLECPSVNSEPFREKCSGTRITSSMISSRDVSDKSEDVRIAHAASNLDIIISAAIRNYVPELLEDKLKNGSLSEGEEISLPILVQTLISPLIPKDKELMRDKRKGMLEISKVFHGEETTQALSDYPKRIQGNLSNGEAFDVFIMPTLYPTNHALNYSRYAEPTHSTDPESLKIISLAEEYLLENPHKEAELSPLLAAYQTLLQESGYLRNIRDNNGQELFLCSLEQLLFVTMKGVPYGSCVSAKDRKSLEFIHTDAMELYFHQYNEWPNYHDEIEKRQNFVTIYALIYVTRHHHCSAGQNAPGSEGIKTPYMYLPTDIQEKITTLYKQDKYGNGRTNLYIDNQLADNNELSSILSDPFSRIDWGQYEKEADALIPKSFHSASKDETQQTKSDNTIDDFSYPSFQRILNDVLNAKFFWHKNTSLQTDMLLNPKKIATDFLMPKGVNQMKDILDDLQKKRTAFSQQTLENLAKISTYRSANKGRFPNTDKFYRLLSDVYLSLGNRAKLLLAVEEFNHFHHEVMTYEKRKNEQQRKTSSQSNTTDKSLKAQAAEPDESNSFVV